MAKGTEVQMVHHLPAAAADLSEAFADWSAKNNPEDDPIQQARWKRLEEEAKDEELAQLSNRPPSNSKPT